MSVTRLRRGCDKISRDDLGSIDVGTPMMEIDITGIADILPPEMLFSLDDIQRAAELVRDCTNRGTFYSELLRIRQVVCEKFKFDRDSEIVNMIQNYTEHK